MNVCGQPKITALIASTAIALVLCAPSTWAADNGGAQGVKGSAANRAAADNPGQQARAAKHITAIHVAAASSLVGRNMEDPQGIDAGKINSLVIDTRNGAVDFVMISPPRSFNAGGDLIAVPWPALQSISAGNGPVATKFGVDKLAKAPRIEARLMYELHRPQQRGHIYDYYGYSYAPLAAYHGYGYQNDSGPVGSAYAPPPLSSVGPPSEAAGSALVIGREGVVAALDSETTTSADALRDTEVYAPSGKEVGDIDEVMIDTDRGKVAYMLLSRGGFLGMDKTWFALPIEALVQTPYRSGYRLTLDEAILNGLPTLHADRQNLPARVSTAQLAALYNHFNIRPYWDQSTQPEAAQTNGSAPLAKEK